MPQKEFVKYRPLTVRCAFCPWKQTGRSAVMLAAQRQHRLAHAQDDNRDPRRPL